MNLWTPSCRWLHRRSFRPDIFGEGLLRRDATNTICRLHDNLLSNRFWTNTYEIRSNLELIHGNVDKLCCEILTIPWNHLYPGGFCRWSDGASDAAKIIEYRISVCHCHFGKLYDPNLFFCVATITVLFLIFSVVVFVNILIGIRIWVWLSRFLALFRTCGWGTRRGLALRWCFCYRFTARFAATTWRL